ncbi:DUF3311 domain-containing protein [Actinoplanes sp. NPDC051475]|uniref:DUF3311 domain-containing protein n=1 Tax=Actinoplanes sp. NPDC051475 TaxID=3157225 RepID=UPI00344E4012
MPASFGPINATPDPVPPRPGDRIPPGGRWPSAGGGHVPPQRPYGSARMAEAEARKRQRAERERSRWHWLLAMPVTLPLLTPLFDRAEPQLWGIPFFYWAQIACIGLAMAVTTLVYQLTRVRG